MTGNLDHRRQKRAAPKTQLAACPSFAVVLGRRGDVSGRDPDLRVFRRPLATSAPPRLGRADPWRFPRASFGPLTGRAVLRAQSEAPGAPSLRLEPWRRRTMGRFRGCFVVTRAAQIKRWAATRWRARTPETFDQRSPACAPTQSLRGRDRARCAGASRPPRPAQLRQTKKKVAGDDASHRSSQSPCRQTRRQGRSPEIAARRGRKETRLIAGWPHAGRGQEAARAIRPQRDRGEEDKRAAQVPELFLGPDSLDDRSRGGALRRSFATGPTSSSFSCCCSPTRPSASGKNARPATRSTL